MKNIEEVTPAVEDTSAPEANSPEMSTVCWRPNLLAVDAKSNPDTLIQTVKAHKTER